MNVNAQSIEAAAERLKVVAQQTPLYFCKRLSERYDAKIYIKREDLQEIRSFKIRGAYNKMATLNEDERESGVVCASAGNHAQGVAYSCAALHIKGAIFMPALTPKQKVEKVRKFGGEFVEIHLVGHTFDDAAAAAKEYADRTRAVFVHAFNDPLTISGQGTVAKEVYEQLDGKFDVFITGIGGGGLMAGCATYLKEKNSAIYVIGSEPTGAAGMHESIKTGNVVALDTIDTFVDGAAVKRVGDLSFELCQRNVDEIVVVPEGKVCTTIIELYQNEGIIAEPAGSLSIAALDFVADKIKGKTVVCVLSGGNNDIMRYAEIVERSLVYEGKKHYFVIEFEQKPGQLKNFLDNALGPNDDIVRFEYIKKSAKEKGPAFVGIELKDKQDLEPLLTRMKEIGMNFKQITNDDMLYHYLV